MNAPSSKLRRLAAAMMITLAAPTLVQEARADAARAADNVSRGAESPDHALAIGNYREAAAGYRRILETHGLSAPVLSNLGAAQLGSGELGEAILSFERARYLAPGDAAVEKNLQAARAAAGLPAETHPSWWKLARLLPVGPWTWLAVAAFWIAASAALALIFTRRGRRITQALAAGGAVVALGSAAAAAASFTTFDRAIVLDSEPAAISPFEGSEIAFSAQEGTRVRLGERHGDYVFVRAPDGRAGWLPSGKVEPIVPRG